VPAEALVMPDGMALALRAWPAAQPRFVVLALHGFGDHGGNSWVEGAPLLNAGGVTVYAYDQRGFGHSPHRGLWPGGQTLVDDARAAARLIAARHPGLPLFLLGESMGGAIAAIAAREPGPIRGVILMAPAVMARGQLPAFAHAVLDGAAAVAPALGVVAGAGGITASDNAAAMRRFGADPLTLRTIRLDMMQGLVDVMDDAVAGLPACCEVPVLVLNGGRDQVVPIRIQRRVLRALPAREGRRILHYPAGFHLLLRDSVRETVARDLLAWMADPRAPIAAEDAARDWLR
jgi:alpha-beta hydrolase superfamily lysophospholipase